MSGKDKQEIQNRIYDLEGQLRMSRACNHEIRSEAQFMERNYSHQLGEMARLSDAVCGWVLRTPPELVPVNIAVMAGEIMQYVEAVRPNEDTKPPEWVMHIIGPDDVIPCVGEFDALRKANQHNKAFARLMADDPSPNNPYCVAIAEVRQ